MRAVVQRVSSASVQVAGSKVGTIARGLLVLLGVEKGDESKDAAYLADKIAHLRVFLDEQGKMNLSLLDLGGELLVVSQFTLLGDCRKGRRPSFDNAAPPEHARILYEEFCAKAAHYAKVERGVFQAEMQVSLVNEGPVTLLLDSRNR